MKILKSRHQGTWVIRLGGSLVRGSGVHRLRDAMEPLVRRGYRRFVLDLSSTTYADAAGIGEIVRADRRARRRGGRVVLAAVPDRVKETLDLTGVTGMLTMTERLGDALRLARSPARAAAGRVSKLVGGVRKGPGIMRKTAEGPCRFIPIPG